MIFHQKYWVLLDPGNSLPGNDFCAHCCLCSHRGQKSYEGYSMMYWETVGNCCSTFTLFTVVLASVQCTVLETLLFQIMFSSYDRYHPLHIGLRMPAHCHWTIYPQLFYVQLENQPVWNHKRKQRIENWFKTLSLLIKSEMSTT